MPFNPNLVRDDSLFDEDDEFELPDDLGQLAEQLGDDAAYLAEKYPAGKSNVEVASQHTRSNYFAGRLALVSTLAAMLLVVLMIPKSSPAPSVSNQKKGVENSVAESEADSSKVDVVNVSRRKSTLVEPVIDESDTPALLMFGASGPEQEAILDWLEQQEDSDETLLSI